MQIQKAKRMQTRCLVLGYDVVGCWAKIVWEWHGYCFAEFVVVES